ncbi:MAG TPA: hypothetical protein VEQ85_08475 [Lacipirellulaceae bacterium]|nr:hypothetical protein [Lacipirellulaceae bacterium]
MSDDIPIHVKQFLGQHVESLAQLEALLALRAEPARAWTPEELSRVLYISEDMCAGILHDLERRSLAEREPLGAVRYANPNPDVDRQLEELAAYYRNHRVAVVTHIYSKPVKKVQTFADAFRIRGEEK